MCLFVSRTSLSSRCSYRSRYPFASPLHTPPDRCRPAALPDLQCRRSRSRPDPRSHRTAVFRCRTAALHKRLRDPHWYTSRCTQYRRRCSGSPSHLRLRPYTYHVPDRRTAGCSRCQWSGCRVFQHNQSHYMTRFVSFCSPPDRPHRNRWFPQRHLRSPMHTRIRHRTQAVRGRHLSSDTYCSPLYTT